MTVVSRPGVLLTAKRRPEFLFLRLGVFLQPSDFDCQLLLERLGFLCVPGGLGFRDLILEEKLFLGDPGLEGGINLGDLLFLLIRQRDGWRLFLEPFHRQFVSRFHFLFPSPGIITLLIQSRKAKANCGCKIKP